MLAFAAAPGEPICASAGDWSCIAPAFIVEETCAIDCSGDIPTRSEALIPAEFGATGDVEGSGPGQLWNVEFVPMAAPASQSAGDLPGDLDLAAFM